MVKRKHFLPFALPDTDESELIQIKEALDSGWVTSSPKTRQFEQAFAETVGISHKLFYGLDESACLFLSPVYHDNNSG